jgi:hypothetical protein
MSTPVPTPPRPGRPAGPRPGLLLLGLLAGGGCSQGPQFAEVEGTVTLNGKPLSGVQVVFMPDPDQGTFGPSSSACTDESGHFRVATDTGQDGAMVGTHRVCVRDLDALSSRPVARPKGPVSKSRCPAPPAAKGAPQPRFSKAYASAAQTPLRRVEVKPGKQTLDLEVK